MATTIIGQKWQVYKFAAVQSITPADGELVCITHTDHPGRIIALIGIENRTIDSLYAEWKEYAPPGTQIFPVTVDTVALPSGARVGDLVLNSGYTAVKIGSQMSVAAGGLVKITKNSPFTVTDAGNIRGPSGSLEGGRNY